jgi:hypothetical protein
MQLSDSYAQPLLPGVNPNNMNSIGSYGTPVQAPDQNFSSGMSATGTATGGVGGMPATYMPPSMRAPAPASMSGAANGIVRNEIGQVGGATDGTGGGWFSSDNLEKYQSIAEVIASLGSVWGGIQENKIARESLAMQKDYAQKNYANSIASFNLALEDRSNSRAAQASSPVGTAAAYYDANKLKV